MFTECFLCTRHCAKCFMWFIDHWLWWERQGLREVACLALWNSASKWLSGNSSSDSLSRLVLGPRSMEYVDINLTHIHSAYTRFIRVLLAPCQPHYHSDLLPVLAGSLFQPPLSPCEVMWLSLPNGMWIEVMCVNSRSRWLSSGCAFPLFSLLSGDRGTLIL